MVSHRKQSNVISPFDLEDRYKLVPAGCPFCGAEGCGVYAGPEPHVTCWKCNADGPTAIRKRSTDGEGIRDAIVLWNERSKVFI